MSFLSFRQFRKQYGSHLVLDIEELSWQAGLHVILGPNGSGKSTLMKSLAGLIPFKGDVIMNDQWNLRTSPQQQRRLINHCEAEPVFPPFLRGSYLMDMFLRFKGGSLDQQESLRESLFIEGYISQKISTYSSGMKKKLALLLAFTGNPQLILLDEPYATLDREAQAGLSRLIVDRLARGCSFVLTSHQDFPGELPINWYWGIRQQQLYLNQSHA